MPRYQPRTFAEARAIVNPVERASALLRLSQEAEDRARMRKADGDKLSETQITALTEFLDEWEASADNFGDEQELMDAVRDAIDNGVLPDNFERAFNAAYQATIEEYNNPSPGLEYDAEGFARALTDLTNAIEGTSYEPNTRESEKTARPATLGTPGRLAAGQGVRKAARPRMRKRGSASRDQIVASMEWGDWDSKGKTRIGTSSFVPGAKFIILKEPIQGYKYQLLVDYNGEKKQIDKNDDPNKLMRHPPAHWIEGNMPDASPAANDAGDEQAYIAAARPRMRKSYGAISNSSRVVRAAQGVFDKLMADDYFSETYSEDELADAAIEIAMRTTGTGPKTKKIVRETGNMFI